MNTNFDHTQKNITDSFGGNAEALQTKFDALCDEFKTEAVNDGVVTTSRTLEVIAKHSDSIEEALMFTWNLAMNVSKLQHADPLDLLLEALKDN